MNQQSEAFFKPVLSTIGLILSFLATITPLFPVAQIDKLFISSDLVWPATLLALTSSSSLAWTIFHNNFYELNLPKLWRSSVKLNITSVIFLLLLLEIIIFGLFFLIPDDANRLFQVIQAILYASYFSILTSVFALLVNETKRKIEYMEKKRMQIETIYETLTRNRLINTGITIIENRDLTTAEANTHLGQSWGGMHKMITLRIPTQPQQEIKVILNINCDELVKVISLSILLCWVF